MRRFALPALSILALERGKRLALLSTVLMFVAAGVSARDLAKAWEVRLSEIPGSYISNAKAHVFSVSFSPDGRRLALVVGGGTRDVAILAVLSTSDLRVGAIATEYRGPVGPAISWSSTEKGVATPQVFRELGQSGCALQHTTVAVFYDSDRVADAQPGSPRTDLLSFDGNCNPVGSWQIEGMWELYDGSADRHLLALANNVPRRTEVIVVDPLRRRLLRRWPLAEVVGAWPLFADNGNAVCATDGTGRRGVAHCWDVDTGHEIAQTSSGNPHTPMATALRARRVVLSDYGWRIDFEGWQTEVGSLKRRVVWDYGIRKDVASWRPRYQDDPARPALREACPFAISPDGTMVAEAGAGLLTLYRVEP